MKRIKLFIVLWLILCLSIYTHAYAQNQPLADSLIGYLEENAHLEDSARYVLLKDIAFNTTNPSISIHYGKEAYKIAGKNGNFSHLGTASYLIGEGYKAQGKLALALQAYLESGQHYQTAAKVQGQATVYQAIANVYAVQKDFKMALRFYEEAISIFQQTNDTLRLAITLQNKGDAFREIQAYDSAYIYFNQSLTLFSSIRYEIGIAYNLGNIGLLQAAQGEFKQAEIQFEEATKILEKFGDHYAIADFSIQMATHYANRADHLQKAFFFAHQGLALATHDELSEQARDGSLMLSRLYSQTKDYEKA